MVIFLSSVLQPVTNDIAVICVLTYGVYPPEDNLCDRCGQIGLVQVVMEAFLFGF